MRAQESKTMNILFVLENYPPHIGGVEMLFQTLCEGLAKKGHKVTVLTRHLPETKRREKKGGVMIVRVPSMNNRYLFTFTAIHQALRLAEDADVIHTTTYNAAFPSWIAAKMEKKPSLITVHETWKGKWKEYTNFSTPVVWLHEFLEWCLYTIPRFDRYVCVSQSTKGMLDSAVKGKNTAVIHNGFDAKEWEEKQPDIAQMRKELKLEKRFVVLAYGRPGASKGFEYFIKSFGTIRQYIPNATFLLILSNDKQYRHKVEQYKKMAGKNAIFLHSQPYKKLIAYVQMADCVVVPSISEGFGYAVLGASAAGTPIVASNTTSIPEVIYGKHVLVEPRNPVAIAEGVHRIYKKEYTTTKKREFPWERTISEYEKMYEAIINEKASTVKEKNSVDEEEENNEERANHTEEEKIK